LISHLDNELWNELHEDQGTYDQFNQVKDIKTAIVVYVNGKPAAIGCFKKFNDNTVEIKRMFVEKEFRGRGLSKYVLNELEKWALECGYQYAVLETSVHFKVAQNLYAGAGYEIIENYDQYKGLIESICMKRELKTQWLNDRNESRKQDAHGTSSFFGRKDIEYFAFEEDFVENNMRCIPMIVRFKMDKAGIKLKLKEWNMFFENERVELSKMPCGRGTEIKEYYEYLAGLIKNHTGNSPTILAVEQQPGWANTDAVPVAISERLKEIGLPFSPQQWKALTQLQRFALVKLSRPGHESKNFEKALIEFGLMPHDQKIETGIESR
jgi:hypothetical protein